MLQALIANEMKPNVEQMIEFTSWKFSNISINVKSIMSAGISFACLYTQESGKNDFNAQLALSLFSRKLSAVSLSSFILKNNIF